MCIQTYTKDTTEKMKTDPKLCDRDGDGENLWKKKYNPHQGKEQSSPLVLLRIVETRHGRQKTLSFCWYVYNLVKMRFQVFCLQVALETPWICRRVSIFPSQFALLSFPTPCTCSPFYITDYHLKPHDYLSFHLCFSRKCLKAPTKTWFTE